MSRTLRAALRRPVAERRLTAIAIALFAVCGCVEAGGFQCESSTQCQDGTSAGVCESSGYCSFEDPGCGSGRRYGQESGSLSGVCTDQAADAATSVDGGAGDDGLDPVDGAVTVDAAPDSPDAAPDSPDAAPELPDAGAIVVDFVPASLPAGLLTAATNGLALQAADGTVEIDSDTGAIVRTSDQADLHPIGVGFTTITQGGGNPDIGVFSMTSLTIDSGVTLVVTGHAALAFAVSGDVTIAGSIELRGGVDSVEAPGAGGFAGAADAECDGDGPGGGEAGSPGDDVGGGGGGYLGDGGEGGARAATAGGDGGSSYGDPTISPLVGGSGGGCGGGANPRAHGGGGGGAIQVSARGTVRVAASGVVQGGGGGGSGGTSDNGGGGGGSGGAIVIEAGRIVIQGVLAANGGGGGAGSDGATGAAGEYGRPSASPASGGTGVGEGGSGGSGGAGTTAAGGGGTGVSGASGSDNAGGGGGAGGRIRLRSDDISRPGTVSPIAGLAEAPL